MNKLTFLSFSTAFTMLLATQAHSALFRIESESSLSVMRDWQNNPRLPFYEFFTASYNSIKKDFNATTSFSFFDDFNAENIESEFNLYLFDVSYSAIPNRLRFFAGRTFSVETTVRPISVDNIGAELSFLQKRFNAGGFIGREGAEREVGQGYTDSTLTGAYANYRTAGLEPLYLKTKWQNRIFDDQEKKSHQIVNVAAVKTFAGSWAPEIMVDEEMRLDTNDIKHFEVGADFYPTINTGFGFRYLKEKPDLEDGLEVPLLAIFAVSPIDEVSFRIQHHVSAAFIPSFAVGYDQYEFEPGQTTYGAKVTLGATGVFDPWNYTNTFMYLSSYGGTVFSDITKINRRLGKKYDIGVGFNLVYYEKITNSRRWAMSSQLEWNTFFWDHFKLNMATELNSNNSRQYDIRVLARLIYWLWGET
ncbi:MAG: hypothetical protein A2Z20_04500 [Bdellovibrionales bacterium RBG_16_40_8]|nr:MAG: hypothetical protein A2Z20_04500 [Bdellovibrionales bacterium RBG_16_40_8]